jgi:hypothetical protein
MMQTSARTRRVWIKKLQLPLLFALIFAAPLYSGSILMGSNYSYAFALSIFAFSFPIFMAQSASATPLNLENWRAIEILLLIVLSTTVFTYYGLGVGLTDRASSRDGITNINNSGSFLVTLIANSNFLVSGVAAYLIQKGLDTRKRKYLYLGVLIAAAMLTISGTRFLFLLAMAPLFYTLFFDRRYLRKLLFFVLIVVASSFVAIARAGFNINVATLVFYDLPSTASALAVQSSVPSFWNIGYFFIGNIVVLIPRAVFPGKPVDPTVVEFTISNLSADAFESGATFLPGFIGSAWLYGAWTGVAIFSLFLGYLFVKSFPNDRLSRSTERTLKALLFIGLILQFRNISIFYLLPFFFMTVGVGSTAALLSFLPNKRASRWI